MGLALEFKRFTKGLNPPGLTESPMGLPPSLQRNNQMGADYLREVLDYVRDKPPGYDTQVHAAPYLSLTERRPGCRTYACAGA